MKIKDKEFVKLKLDTEFTFEHAFKAQEIIANIYQSGDLIATNEKELANKLQSQNVIKLFKPLILPMLALIYREKTETEFNEDKYNKRVELFKQLPYNQSYVKDIIDFFGGNMKSIMDGFQMFSAINQAGAS